MRFFEDARALDSLRHSDFDALSAYGEVIDNALQAEATRIALKFDMAPPKHTFEQIQTLAFGDNGHGMPKDVLHACLKLGYSSRYNDRSGIGRFGVGMVLGAIHEVKRVDVYSKEKNGRWFHTYIDLDEIENGSLDQIPDPTLSAIPDQYSDLVGEEQGTLVLWTKYDKQKVSGSKLKDEAEHWIGRTFRYFIWEGIEILINGQTIAAHDPLYARTENTKFPNDPKAKSYDPIKFDWPISPSDSAGTSKDSSEITINLSLLPEEFRPNQGAGGSADARARKINENTGISILRNRREVFYGQLPYWSSVRLDGSRSATWNWEDKDRFWGGEILFDAELDSDFSVKNIKRGAEPLRELKSTIKKLITPTRKTAQEEIDRVWTKAKQDKKDKEHAADNELGRGPHSAAEDVAQKVATPKSLYKANVSPEEAADELAKTALSNLEEDKRAQYLALFKSQPFTIQDDRWKGQTFWEVYHAGGHTLLSYNLNHNFFSSANDLLEQLESEECEPAEIAKQMRELIDLLLISAAKAQSLHEEDVPVASSGYLIETLNSQWGMMLANYVNEWQKTKG